MPDQKIYVLGNEEIVLLLGLLGIEGTIVEDNENFLKAFKNLIKNDSIVMIIIAINLPDDIIEYLIDFKLNNRTPLIFIMPDIFQPDIENHDQILNRILDSIMEIVS